MVNKSFSAKTFLYLLAGLALILIATATGHCTTTGKQPNSIGVIVSDVNPNDSLIGIVMSGEIHEDSDGRLGTNIRVHPKYTYSLFDESLMFCGNEADRLTKDDHMIAGWHTLTFRRQASRLIDGIPCHALIGVDEAKDQQ